MTMVRVITFKLDATILEVLDKTARRLGLSRSELIREAILRYLDDLGVDIPKGNGYVTGGDGERHTIILEG